MAGRSAADISGRELPGHPAGRPGCHAKTGPIQHVGAGLRGGAGRSAKPSDGLRAKFPRYNHDDMVQAQHRLVTEVLGIRHLRLVMGNSMGGMHTWLWADKLLDSRLNAPFTADANDFLYQWESPGDYTAAAQLDRIKAAPKRVN